MRRRIPGTIFLDEISSTTQKLQIKLLRVLQEREFERVGDTQTIRVDVRVIAASNHDLHDLVDKHEFREDLYYRLNVVPIRLPPLRQRREDIAGVGEPFSRTVQRGKRSKSEEVEKKAKEALEDYHWPGNVRELQNVIERAVVMATGDVLTCDLLPPAVMGEGKGARAFAAHGAAVDLETLASELVQQGVGRGRRE